MSCCIGLSHIVSVVGNPICADSSTSQLEILPFARFCVEYIVGKDLPSKIPVLVVESNENESVVDVVVEYPRKHLVCSGCKTLGHQISVCPNVKRVWMRKSSGTENVEKVVDEANTFEKSVEKVVNEANAFEKSTGDPLKKQMASNVEFKDLPRNEEPSTAGNCGCDLEVSPENEWKVVRNRRSSLHCSIPGPLFPEAFSTNDVNILSTRSTESPALPMSFRNMMVDEIAKKHLTTSTSFENCEKSLKHKRKKSVRGVPLPKS